LLLFFCDDLSVVFTIFAILDFSLWQNKAIEGLRERTEYIDIFLFPPITQSCSVSNVLFTGGMGSVRF